MAGRSIWNGSCSLALLNFGIKIYKATQESNIHYRLLHKDCETRPKQKRVCEVCNREVTNEELIKAFQLDEEHFVTFTDEEIASLAEDGNKKNIKIEAFVPKNLIDPVAFNDFYYLVPDKGYARAYHLMREALQSMNGMLIGKWIYRGKENFVALTHRENAIVMIILRYAEEITGLADIPAIDTKDMPSADEIKLAVELIMKYKKEDWKLQDSSDYVKRFEELMNKKSMNAISGSLGKEAPKEKPKVATPSDLMQGLRASLGISEIAPAPVEEKPKEMILATTEVPTGTSEEVKEMKTVMAELPKEEESKTSTGKPKLRLKRKTS